MRTSSWSGSYRGGGLGSLSSSSNLSPLAPPFEVDKSLQKQNSLNTSLSYPEMPMYVPSTDSAAQLWNHSSSSVSGSKFATTESTGISTAHPTSPAVYGYSGSQPSSTTPTVAAYDPFSFDPFPYVSPRRKNDGYLTSGVSNRHGYDLLLNSTSAHLSGCGSSVSDHPQGGPGDEGRKPNWGGFWSGVNEQGNQSEYHKGFGSKDSKSFDLLTCKSPFDGSNERQASIDALAHTFVDDNSNINHRDRGNGSHLKQDGCFDIFGGAYHLGSLGIDPQDSRSLSGCSRISSYVPTFTPKDSSHFQEPVVDSVINFCASQKANGSLLGDHGSQSDSYVFGCPSTPSIFPVAVNNEVANSALKLNPEVSVAANKSNLSAGYNYSYPIEPRVSLGLKRKSSIIIKRPPSSAMPSFGQIGQSFDNKVGSKGGSDKSQVSLKMPCQLSSDCLDLEVNNAQACSVEKLSGGTDIHNPAEDSPCWRGSSSNRFSPFSVPEGIAPDEFVKNLEGCKNLDTQDSQMKSSIVDSSDFGNIFSEKMKERNPSKRLLVPECVPIDNEENCSAIRQPHCFDLNAGVGPHDSYVSTNECCLLNKPKAVSQPGITLADIHISEGAKIPSPGQSSEGVASKGCGNHPPVSFEGSENFPKVVSNNSLDAPSNSGNNHSFSPPGDNANLKLYQLSSKMSDSNTDIDMLLKTMINLSEIFRSYCLHKRSSIPEQHSITIKHVIANLNTSMLMMAEQSSSTMPSSEINNLMKELPLAQMVDGVSVNDDPNTIGDVIKAEAIKKILHGNSLGEEEMEQQNLLYKSLWLEAEASLSAMTAKARFLRVKAEVERAHDVVKERNISLSSNFSGNVHETAAPAADCKDSSVLSDCQKPCATKQTNCVEVPIVNKCHREVATDNPVESEDFKGIEATEEETIFPSLDASRQGNVANDSVESGSISHVNDVEASVLTRYQILMSRIENSEAPSQECTKSSGGDIDSSSMYALGYYSPAMGTPSDAMGADNILLAKIQHINCRLSLDSPSNGFNASEGEDNYLPDRDASSAIYQILECEADNTDSLYEGGDSKNSQSLSNSVGASEVGEASVLARFRILQSRLNHSDALDKDQIHASSVKVVDDGTDELGMSEQQSNILKSAFGPYPRVTEDNDIHSGVSVLKQQVYLDPPNGWTGEIFESWYDNGCSSSDWEHVSKEVFRRRY